MTRTLFDEIPAGETVSIENSKDAGLKLRLVCNSGSEFNFELLPGQALGFTADREGAKIFLVEGDPKSLLIIKPETAT
jgi:hypothetical protein